MKTIMTFLLLAGIACEAFSQPILESVSPNWAHKSTATIVGSNFGSKSPAAPLMWDDCESANTDSDPSTTVANAFSLVPYAEILPSPNNSSVASGFKTKYRDVNFAPGGIQVDGPHKFSSKYIAGGHQNTGIQGLVDNVALTVATNSGYANRWFIHFYYRLNPEWPHPCGAGPNHKILTFQSELGAYGTGGNQYFYNDFDHHPCVGDSYVLMKAHPNRAVDQANGQNAPPDTSAPWAMWGGVRFPNPLFNWIKISQEISNDQGFLIIRGNNKVVWGGTGNPYFFTGTGNYKLGYSGIRSATAGGFYRYDYNQQNNNNAFRFFDDIYIDSTLSRVMLCDTPSYGDATVCEPQIPTAWGNNSITVSVNRGGLKSSNAYLFVFNSDNIANTQGFGIELAGAPAPNAPTGLSIPNRQ